MGIPLAGNFDVAVNQPIDSRIVWTGSSNNLNNIPNKFPGLISYVTGEQNLYFFRNDQVWEKIVTNNVDSPIVIQDTNIFAIESNFNGQVIYVDSLNPVTASLLSPHTLYGNGFNVTFVQLGIGTITVEALPGVQTPQIVNRLDLKQTAGQYAVVSLLKISNTNKFILYGDLI